MIVYRTRTCNTSCNTITLTYTTIIRFLYLVVWLGCLVLVVVLVHARASYKGDHHKQSLSYQTPTCTPIILDGLAVKCVMWGSARTHRVHLPTLGLDGQVYVCMCMGRYSV